MGSLETRLFYTCSPFLYWYHAIVGPQGANPFKILMRTCASLTPSAAGAMFFIFIDQNSHYYDFQISQGFRKPTITLFTSEGASGPLNMWWWMWLHPCRGRGSGIHACSSSPPSLLKQSSWHRPDLEEHHLEADHHSQHGTQHCQWDSEAPPEGEMWQCYGCWCRWRQWKVEVEEMQLMEKDLHHHQAV